jgi:hypothetical protein
MISPRKIVLFALAISFLTEPCAQAALTCGDHFARPLTETEKSIALDPDAGLRAILEVDTGRVRSWRTQRRLNKIKWEKNLSEGQIHALVDSLFALRYGEPNKYRMILKDPETRFKARLLKITQKEMAANGLLRYFADRNQLLPKDSIITKVKRILRSNEFEGFLAASTIFSIKSGTPIFRMPNLTLLKVSSTEMETLLLKGIESKEGAAIIKGLLPEANIDFRYSIARQTFNRIAFIIGVALITDKIWEDQEATAQENGRIFAEEMSSKLGSMEQKASQMRNRDDIAMDVMLAKFPEVLKRKPTEEDMAQLCVKLPTARRCH